MFEHLHLSYLSVRLFPGWEEITNKISHPFVPTVSFHSLEWNSSDGERVTNSYTLFSYFYIGYCNVFENVIVTRDGENFIADYKLAIWYSDDASITKEEPRPSLNYRLKNSTTRILLKNTTRRCGGEMLILPWTIVSSLCTPFL